MNAIKCINRETLEHVINPGDFCFNSAKTKIYIVIPTGDTCVVHIQKRGGPTPMSDGAPVWTWDGDEQKPTLQPSLDVKGQGAWHGWLRGGELYKA